jgi:predicted  nucleic acid-binding Zn-ribbon protein
MENQSVAQKLEALVRLQTIDSKIDELKKLRGDLPDEVQDLEDELEGYRTRMGREGG